MPKRADVHKILIIGSGPIIIGQACEFDYSGTQACKALRALGYQIVLVNSNPATIMTDPEMADATYIEPLNVTRLTQIIEKERPDAVLPNLGGQSGLNLCSELAHAGVLERFGVKIIGVQLDAIERGEDRVLFKQAMDKLGIEMARSEVAYTVEQAASIAAELGYPVVLRPAYTMGGAGGGMVYNVEELKSVVERGLAASLVGQVLVEECIIGWEELEVEVVRDATGHMIAVCFIENIDPMGVHTGDSFCSAPMLTVPQSVQDRLREQAFQIVDSIAVIGGTNVQFAHDPVSDRIIVIEINPRTSRSSALASKATGFPIAWVSAMLACGLTLAELECGHFGTLDQYVPGGDYVVIKFARWAFEKFKDSQDRLGTQMRAVGEVMSIGRTYKEAFQKAIRSLENGRHGLGFAKDFHEKTLEELMSLLAYPTSERQFVLYEALRKGASVQALHKLTGIKTYFLEQMLELVNEEQILLSAKGLNHVSAEQLRSAKQNGFGDSYLAKLLDTDEDSIRQARQAHGIRQHWEGVHVSGTANREYYYSTYHPRGERALTPPEPGRRIMILGGGPNRIGQGIEFDYCCVHASVALREMGFETIIINCNPETVSTDYDTSDRLYFEPLTLETVLDIYDFEKPLGVIAQFGGQTPLNLAAGLKASGVEILGTTPETIDMAEDRDCFNAMMDRLGIPMPESGMAVTADDALTIARRVGYPVMVRPSYVLGGRGMEIVYDDDMLRVYMAAAVGVTPDRPILIDRFLNHATECEADAVSDGTDCFVPAVMEHIELAGVHSGDSACVLPPVTLSPKHIALIEDYTRRIAVEMKVYGLMNMQYAIEGDTVYVLEANPRASRTVPLVSKVCDINMVRRAVEIITMPYTGRPSPVPGLTHKSYRHFGVKEAVFPFNMFQEVDPVLGPEMRSTGEVLGLSSNFGAAFFKAQEATQSMLPLGGTVLLSVNDRDKAELPDIARGFLEAGFTLMATGGCHALLQSLGIESAKVFKQHEGRPNITDKIANGEIQMLLNTPSGRVSLHDDSYIRKAAIRARIPYVTTMAAAKASVAGILAARNGMGDVCSLQDFHRIMGDEQLTMDN